MWILILTLLSSSSSVGQTMVAVPGFTSKAACLAAANKWQDAIRATDDFRVPRAICAKE